MQIKGTFSSAFTTPVWEGALSGEGHTEGPGSIGQDKPHESQ